MHSKKIANFVHSQMQMKKLSLAKVTLRPSGRTKILKVKKCSKKVICLVSHKKLQTA